MQKLSILWITVRWTGSDGQGGEDTANPSADYLSSCLAIKPIFASFFSDLTLIFSSLQALRLIEVASASVT